ncbi:six-hairpin glycosidase-like protein [Diplodia corticola]|uniref:Six-hairpin glycosidase-like protein n=1 Tax=Diplodia corticola TaxID=236234 RepID=A0A1J9RD74_9PEZI|nr:six-hairpin glycosidase-like protein [Diplodia corticola]OJD30475.1 six-hairpin glycosidase-like protein [Diplodia corticola]
MHYEEYEEKPRRRSPRQTPAPEPKPSSLRVATLAAALLALPGLLLYYTDTLTPPVTMKLPNLACAVSLLLINPAKCSPTTTSTTTNTTTPSLLPFLLAPLPLGSIRPTGWLRSTLALSAAGLAGHQADFYPYVANSSWLHARPPSSNSSNSSSSPSAPGSEYSPLNEGFPYWLNGLVPLAYALDDARLKAQVGDAVGKVLALQEEEGSGWLGPEGDGDGANGRNLWARYPLLLGLVGLAEAEPETWGERVVRGMWAFVGGMAGMLEDGGRGYVWREGEEGEGGLSEEEFTWGRVRVQDLLVSLQWLWERGETTAEQREVLAGAMRVLIDGAIDWAEWWQEGVFIKEDLNFLDSEPADGERYPYEHGVNAGQGLKALAVFRRFTHNDSLVDITRRGVDWTFKYHAAAHGGILADERLAGLAPYYGSETCTLVETMYSLSYLYQALGNNSYADLAETIAFNALPAQMSPDWWGRQYVGQPNQGFATELDENPFYNVRESGLLYSVEANYPCCTVNHPQGLPKFLANSFARVGDNAIAHMLLSPANLSTTLAGGNTTITIACDTHYPFANTLYYTITTNSSTTTTTNPPTFHIRVPTWADLSNSTLTLTTTNTTSTPLSPDPSTGLHAIPLPPTGTTRLTYSLAAPLVVLPRANDTFTVRRGALVFALAVPSLNTSAHPPQSWSDASVPLRGVGDENEGIPAAAVDWRVENDGLWNVGVDEGSLVWRSGLEEGGGEGGGPLAALPDTVFAPGEAPVWVEGRGCEIEGWGLYKGVVGLPPGTTRAERRCVGGVRTLRLEPVGAAKLRMMDLAAVDLEGVDVGE